MENKRLTKKIIEKNVDGYVLNHREDFTENTYEVIQKLGQLEDLEEQLGCPLEVVFKALKQDYIYTKNRKYLGVELGIYGVDWCICCGLRLQIRVADYKKTWWLKEDSSE